VALADDLERIAAAAVAFAGPNERISGILAAEPLGAKRVYVCAFESEAGHEWLALDEEGRPIGSRRLVRDAAELAALCEVAEELAGIDPVEPRLATSAYLDELGVRLGREAAPVFEQALPAVEELSAQVVARHKTPLT
jgi:hypothetical protein